MTLLLKKKWVKYSHFIFIFHFYAKNLTQKERLIMTCVFECFQSHCHILKELHEFLCMMGVIFICRENVFIFSFVIKDW
jgi:hypothetical protein